MRSLPAIVSALAVSALAGCAAAPPPPPPLMSPYPAAGYGYGYAEERIGPDLLRVVYYGPLRPLDGAARGAALERAASEAADLALWRAAQLALAEGRPAFAIVERRADTETVRRPGYFYDPWWPQHCWPYGPHWACRGWPPAYYPPTAEGRARATLTVRLESRATGRNIDAAATVRRFESAHRPLGPPSGPPPNPPRAPPRS